MPKKGETGYCSERCLHWDFFGVPALEEKSFLREMRRNQQLEEIPNGWTSPAAYPEFGEAFCHEVTRSLAVLKDSCDFLRTHA